MTLQQVFEQKGPKIADVRIRIDGRSAGIHLHLFFGRIDWPKRFNGSRISIVELNHARLAFGVSRLAFRG
jgi:hypothetical protein